MAKFEVGQEVILTAPYGKKTHEIAYVRKVGRQYAYASPAHFENSHHNWRKFDMETGAEHIPGGYTGGTIYTLDEWDDREARGDLIEELRVLGVSFDWNKGKRLTTNKLQAILNIMKEEES